MSGRRIFLLANTPVPWHECGGPRRGIIARPFHHQKRAMSNSKSAVIVKLAVASVPAVGPVVLFSVPIDPSAPPPGKLLFPGNGIWFVPAGYPKSTKYNISALHGKVIAHRSKNPRHGALKFANMTGREEGLVKIPGVREPGRRFMNTLSITA
jgi:hypothetical protein